jgi:hypothetical protein
MKRCNFLGVWHNQYNESIGRGGMMEELITEIKPITHLPFNKELAANIDKQLDRIEFHKASCILIDGPLGSGKTTTAVRITDYVNEKKELPEMNLKISEHPQIALGGGDFNSFFRQAFKQHLPVVVYDEAGDFNRRGAVTRFNMLINRFFEIYRGFKILVIVCIPNFAVLDSHFFENQIPRMLIHMEKKGQYKAKYLAYSLSGMNWIRWYYLKMGVGARHRCYYSVAPNFHGWIQNLPAARDKQLDSLSTRGKDEILSKNERKLKGLVSQTEISQSLGVSLDWVNYHIRKINYKCVSKDKQTKLYPSEIKEILFEQIQRNRK